MRRASLAIFGAVLALATAAGIGLAQQAPPTVAVTASPTSVAVQATGPIPAGPTRFEITRQGDRPVAVYFFLLNAGVSLQEFQAAMARDEPTGGESGLGMIWIQAAVPLSGRQAQRGVTFTLRPGLTYVVLTEVLEEGESAPRQHGITTFTTSGASNGATAGRPDATIRMVGLRFRGDRVLPRRGVVRFENRDADAHFAIAFPLRRGVSLRQFGRALRGPSERAFRRVVAGAPYDVQGLISGGNIVNDQEVQFPRAGRYGLVCFIHGHDRLGMYRIVTVR